MTYDANLEEKAKILLVEDNPVDIDLTLRAFKKQMGHFNIEIAKDGEEASQTIQRWISGEEAPPDIILMDLKMPRMDGFDVLKILKQSPVSSAIPVIILTSSNEENDIVAAYQLGANSYLLKPIDYSKFLTLIQLIVQYWIEENCTVRS
jgi:CheY-like chemotaxis protein